MDLGAAVEGIQQAGDAQASFSSFVAALAPLGFDKANISFLTDHPSLGVEFKFGFATSYPDDWVTHYAENSYGDFDPVRQRALQKSGMFLWSDATLERQRDQTLSQADVDLSVRLMNEASDAGLADGVGVSFINQFGEITGINASTEVQNLNPSLDDVAKIAVAATALHDKIRSTFPHRKPVHLTTRERDVLSWAAEGKTDGEIATLLGVSHHGIRFHWNNIFRKMDVNSRLLATMAAVRMRLVHPIKIHAARTLKPE